MLRAAVQIRHTTTVDRQHENKSGFHRGGGESKTFISKVLTGSKSAKAILRFFFLRAEKQLFCSFLLRNSLSEKTRSFPPLEIRFSVPEGGVGVVVRFYLSFLFLFQDNFLFSFLPFFRFMIATLRLLRNTL